VNWNRNREGEGEKAGFNVGFKKVGVGLNHRYYCDGIGG